MPQFYTHTHTHTHTKVLGEKPWGFMVHENLRWNPKMEAKRTQNSVGWIGGSRAWKRVYHKMDEKGWALVRFTHRRGIRLLWAPDEGYNSLENQCNRQTVCLYSRSDKCKADELWVRFACRRIQQAWRRCNYNPEFAVCRKRLRSECSEFPSDLCGRWKRSPGV